MTLNRWHVARCKNAIKIFDGLGVLLRPRCFIAAGTLTPPRLVSRGLRSAASAGRESDGENCAASKLG